jgi:hypothetical protein
LAPSSSTIGSANRRDQDTTQLRKQNRGIQAIICRFVPLREQIRARGLF